MGIGMIMFEDIPSVRADHPAWNDDPEQQNEKGMKLVIYSIFMDYAMKGLEVEDVEIKTHSNRPFLNWVKRKEC
jgi:hypothetical protein